VTSRYTDSATQQRRLCTLEAAEFLRRYLQHVPPAGQHRVRYFGWMHPSAKARRLRVECLLQKPIVVAAAPPEAVQWHLRCPHCARVVTTFARSPGTHGGHPPLCSGPYLRFGHLRAAALRHARARRFVATPGPRSSALHAMSADDHPALLRPVLRVARGSLAAKKEKSSDDRSDRRRYAPPAIYCAALGFAATRSRSLNLLRRTRALTANPTQSA